MLTATITLRPKGTLQTQTVTWFTGKSEPQVVLTERAIEPMLHIKREMNFTMESAHGLFTGNTAPQDRKEQ